MALSTDWIDLLMRVFGFDSLLRCSLLLPALSLGASSAHAETTGDPDTDGWEEPMVYINSPANMEVVGDAPAQFMVDVTADIGGVFFPTLELAVDGAVLEMSCTEVAACMFEVELETAGEHVLEARLSDGPVLATDTITVVVGEMPATTGDDAGSDDAGHDDGDETSGGAKGCSVGATGPGGITLAGALLLLAAGAGRRRRR